MYSIVSVLDDPTLELKLSVFSNHTGSKETLSPLIVEEDANVVGEGWASEMGEGNLSGTKSNVEWSKVEEDSDKAGLEAESEVTHGVDHTLLGEREVSGLADHEISPLDSDDGDEVSGLSVLEGLGGVADWVA